MEYALAKKKLSVCETVFEGSLEQPIDLDISLPDYCPDIQQILKSDTPTAKARWVLNYVDFQIYSKAYKTNLFH